MKKQWKGFISGIISTVLVLGLVMTASATVGKKTVDLDYNDIKVTLNGTQVNLVDVSGAAVEPFIINGTTYPPIRAISSALGLAVDWDGATKTVVLSGSTDGLDAVTPEFKASMDSYLNFFETYMEFMKKYEQSDGSAQLEQDYSDLMAKYDDLEKKLTAIQDQDLSPADQGYYAYTLAKVVELLDIGP